MNHMSSHAPVPQPADSDYVDIFELFLPILNNWTFIFKITIYGFLLSVLISLLLPRYYQSTAKILPPQTQSSVSQQLLSQFSGMSMLSGGGAAIKDTSALYSELLRCNGVLDYVIEKNRLKEIYGVDRLPVLRTRLRRNISISSDKKSGIMTIGYTDRVPQRSFEIMESFIEGLKKINNEIAITEASQRRLFYEEQLKGAKDALIRAEEEMKAFQQKTGSIKIDEEAKAAIEEASVLRAKISAKEVQLKVLQGYATKENPEYKSLEATIVSLKEQLSKFQSKMPSDDDSLFSTKKASIYGTEFIRKTREFKYTESLYEILLKQYEAARLDESKDSTVIQIVERPEIPTFKFSPRRGKIVVVWTLIAFVFAVFVSFFANFYENFKKDGENAKKLEIALKAFSVSSLRSDLQSDWDRVKTIANKFNKNKS